MWQALRNELHPQGLEVVTVGMDTAGPEACRHFIEAASPEHPSLIDANHIVAAKFGIINIPNSIWIDEDGMIVRPAEAAPAPPSIEVERTNPFGGMTEFPDRATAIMSEAVHIEASPAEYEAALRDWVGNGADSVYALSPDEVIARSQPRDDNTSKGQAHFAMATHLEQLGDHAAAIGHFRMAHQLVPDNFAYRRQAWSLEPGGDADSPFARFWQGPDEGNEEAWPYDSEWVADVQAMGAANYYPKFTP